MLFFIVIESIADNQQFRFQKLKRRIDNHSGTSESLRRGFLSEGLWKVVRHPNYISEQGIWISFYLFGSAASGKLFNWTIIGPLLMVLLFQGSTSFTEQISSEKYSDYPLYKKEVPKFLPRFRFRNRS
jgi:steroid 5-alpha reductase family enzyme